MRILAITKVVIKPRDAQKVDPLVSSAPSIECVGDVGCGKQHQWFERGVGAEVCPAQSRPLQASLVPLRHSWRLQVAYKWQFDPCSRNDDVEDVLGVASH